LPVQPEPVAGDPLVEARAEPPSVLVRGPQDVLERAQAILTQPYVLPPHPEPISRPERLTLEEVPLAGEIDGRHVRTYPTAVTVHLVLQPRQKLYELSDVPIHFLCPADFPLKALFADQRASKVSLKLLGPATEEPPAILAFVDLRSRKWEPGQYEEPLRLQLPKHFKLADDSPRQVTFQLVPQGSIINH
jgi:hypothetical protein